MSKQGAAQVLLGENVVDGRCRRNCNLDGLKMALLFGGLPSIKVSVLLQEGDISNRVTGNVRVKYESDAVNALGMPISAKRRLYSEFDADLAQKVFASAKSFWYFSRQ